MVLEHIDLIKTDGYAVLINDFIVAPKVDYYYQQLLEQLKWQEERYTIFGKEVLAPRKVCWYGDKDAVYKYSGICHQPLPWHELLLKLKLRIESLIDCRFNSVLGNLYRSGIDSMGWHADKEPELGKNPCVASLSFGDSRLFKFRHNKTKQIVDIVLTRGSLLIMSGELQYHWQHSLPKTKKSSHPRINLTYRNIIKK